MDSVLIGALANLGFGGLVVLLIVLGWLVPRGAHRQVLEDSARKDAVIAKLEDALAIERHRADEVTQAGTVTNQLISGLVQLAGGHRPDGVVPAPAIAPAAPAAPSGKGTGL